MAAMGLRLEALVTRLDALQRETESLRAFGAWKTPLDRFSADAQAVRFHLRRDVRQPPILVILGGTGAGKSTVMNRLLGRDVSAASFRRTFTGGAVAAIGADAMPAQWGDMLHEPADPAAGPVRGRGGVVTVVAQSSPPGLPILVDTPDLDGDLPAHHAQADRLFRWADAVLFVVSPEKYQMTELLPYYRLAERYALPAFHLMNKCESAQMLDDFAQQRGLQQLYAIPRDDAAYEPSPQAGLAALRQAVGGLALPAAELRNKGIAHRLLDLTGRLNDDLIATMQRQRTAADALIVALQAMQAPPVGVDVNPITRQLRNRLRQRSVLYLMGPQRVLDRVRQAPILLAKLPRATWDILIRGKAPALDEPKMAGFDDKVPDFAQLLKDQFTQLLSRIDDTVRSTQAGAAWIAQDEAAWRSSLIDPTQAGQIAGDELENLRQWLQQRWNATPRDTRLLQSLVRRLPGGAKMLQWTEASPYLLTIILAAHGALFGHVDLAVLGGYSLVAWIIERLSNEVAARTRLANTQIERRFTDLAQRQLRSTIAWVNRQVPTRGAIRRLELLAADLAEVEKLRD